MPKNLPDHRPKPRAIRSSFSLADSFCYALGLVMLELQLGGITCIRSKVLCFYAPDSEILAHLRQEVGCHEAGLGKNKNKLVV